MKYNPLTNSKPHCPNKHSFRMKTCPPFDRNVRSFSRKGEQIPTQTNGRFIQDGRLFSTWLDFAPENWVKQTAGIIFAKSNPCIYEIC